MIKRNLVMLISFTALLFLFGCNSNKGKDVDKEATKISITDNDKSSIKVTVDKEYLKISVADNGKALMKVIVSVGETIPEKTAAKELVTYLKKITGADFLIQKESEFNGDSPALYLGQTEYAKKNGIDFSTFSDEEWMVKTNNDSIIIAGGRPRGTLYGVYHFLEDDLGVRWWTPQAESVPCKSNLVIGKLERRAKPLFAYRDVRVGGEGRDEFSARNRVSLAYLPIYGSRTLLFGGPNACHTLYPFLGKKEEVKKLYQAHPDWFPLIDGVRKLDPVKQDGAAQTQLCLSNPELRKFFLERVRGFIKEDKEKAIKQGQEPPMFYAIDQNDAFDGFCKCDKCMEISKREEATSGIILDFTNYIAENLKSETDATFLMMAEHVLEKPPKLMKALPNVGIRLCDTTSNMIQAWTAPDNAKHRLNLDGWSKITDKIVVWDYTIHYGGEFSGINLPFPNERTFAPDLRYLVEHNGYGIFFQHEEIIRGDMRDLKLWLEAKLAENPYLDYDSLVKEFTDGFYGLAGQYIRQYRSLLETLADKSKTKLTYFPGAASFTYLDCEFILPAMKIFDDAEKVVGNDSELLQRVRYARFSLDRAFLVKVNTLKSEWKKQGKNEKDFPVDSEQVLARYKQTWHDACERKLSAGKYNTMREEERVVHEKFLDGLSKRKSLPVPERFKDVPQEKLYDFNSELFTTYVNYWKQVEAPDTIVGKAWKASIVDIIKVAENLPEYGTDNFITPFPWAVWPTVSGTIKGSTEVPANIKNGYNWYKLGSTFKLMKNSECGIFTGIMLTLDAVIADNSDLGQEYEIWASVKFEGSGFSSDGQPNKDLSIYIDRVIVIQKTSNK